MDKDWYKSKAVWASIGLVLTAIGGFMTGNATILETITTMLIGLRVAGIRVAQR